MSNQAGWRSRQATTVINRGKQTTVRMWKSTDSEAFHIREAVKMMGQQEVVAFESLLPFDEAYQEYAARATTALLEEVSPPDTNRQIVGPFGNEDGEDDG